jgi:hypothetical protein
MSITRGNAENYETDAITVSGRKLCIKVTETGYYRIDVEGPGDKLALCDELFTTLSAARKAIAAYVADHQAAINKRKFVIEIAEKQKAEDIAKSRRK